MVKYTSHGLAGHMPNLLQSTQKTPVTPLYDISACNNEQIYKIWWFLAPSFSSIWL